MRAAQRICFAVTIVRSLPFLFLVLLAMWLLPTAGMIGVAVAQFLFDILFTFVLFVHSDG